MISDDVIQLIIDRVSIVDVVSRVTEVKKSGKNYMAKCPFHNERTPSFSISEEKGLYHCFGCGASGNTITFLMEYYKIDFREAVERLADMAGIDLSEYDSKENQGLLKEKKVLLKINNEVMEYFHNRFLSSQEAEKARNYIKNRNINLDMIKLFKIGYGGNDNNLFDYLKSKGYTEEYILKSGLCIKTNTGFYDRFRDRVIFPIFDKDGKCVGFGGRILEDRKDIAKYLNSQESILFHKGSLLFALHLALEEIAKQKCVYVCEGYMDVIALFQNNIKNVVAPLGTAITESQIQQLKKYTNNVIFLFDGDEAGINAANRAIDISSNIDVNIKIIILPNKMDPYDFVMKYGKIKTLEYFEKKLLDPINFKLVFFSKKFSIENDKINFVKNIFTYVRTRKSAIEREEAIKKIASFIKEKPETVLIEYQNFLKKEPSFGRLIDDKNIKTKNKEKHEIEFIGGLIKFINQKDDFLFLVDENMLNNQIARDLFIKIKNGESDIKKLLFNLDKEVVEAISKILNKVISYEIVLAQAYNIRYLYLKRLIPKITDIQKKQDLKKELIDLEEVIKSFIHN